MYVNCVQNIEKWSHSSKRWIHISGSMSFINCVHAVAFGWSMFVVYYCCLGVFVHSGCMMVHVLRTFKKLVPQTCACCIVQGTCVKNLTQVLNFHHSFLHSWNGRKRCQTLQLPPKDHTQMSFSEYCLLRHQFHDRFIRLKIFVKDKYLIISRRTTEN